MDSWTPISFPKVFTQYQLKTLPLLQKLVPKVAYKGNTEYALHFTYSSALYENNYLGD